MKISFKSLQYRLVPRFSSFATWNLTSSTQFNHFLSNHWKSTFGTNYQVIDRSTIQSTLRTLSRWIFRNSRHYHKRLSTCRKMKLNSSWGQTVSRNLSACRRSLPWQRFIKVLKKKRRQTALSLQPRLAMFSSWTLNRSAFFMKQEFATSKQRLISSRRVVLIKMTSRLLLQHARVHFAFLEKIGLKVVRLWS